MTENKNQTSDLVFPSLEKLKNDKTGTFSQMTTTRGDYRFTETNYKSKDGKKIYSGLEVKPI